MEFSISEIKALKAEARADQIEKDANLCDQVRDEGTLCIPRDVA